MVAAHLSLLAASAAVLVSAQVPLPFTPDLSAGCTSRSFSLPSWLVENIKKSDEDVSFHVSNRATNFTSDVACKGGNAGAWADCTAKTGEGLKASVKVTGSSVQFLLNQTWTCSDRSTSLTFTAVGNNSAPLNWTSPLLVKGSLLKPASLTPAYLDGPTGHNAPGCMATSEKPSWKLSTIVFTDQTGDGTTSQAHQMFNLLVTNPANGYEASCMPATSFSQGPDLTTLTCAGNEFQSTSIGGFPITTTASFDVKTFTFSLKQTWFCDDHDASKPLNITATGSIVLPLECTSVLVPDSPNDTKKTCQIPNDADVTVPGNLGTVTTLKPFVIEDPIPGRDGCTLTSIFHPQWAFSQFSVTTLTSETSSPSTSAAVPKQELFFNIILQTDSRGFQYPIPIYQGEPVAGQEGWYKCVVGKDGENAAPLWPYECSFTYNSSTKGLTIKADWACQEFDPAHPILFSGVSTTTVTSPFTCDATFEGNTECIIDGTVTWTAPITNVTWKSSP